VGSELNGSRAPQPASALPSATAVIGAAAVGLALLMAAWVGASDQRDSADQMTWLNLGVAGVLVTAGVCGTWVLQGRRAVEHRLAVVLSGADEIVLDDIAEAAGPERLATAARMTRYHLPDCLLLAGKAVSFETRAAHEQAGLQPCEMCSP